MTNPAVLQKLEQSVNRLRDERQFKRDIINSLHDGVIVFREDLSIQTLNQKAKNLLGLNQDFKVEDFFEQTHFFKNKKCSINFNLERWLHKLLENKSHDSHEKYLWNCTGAREPRPLLLNSKIVYNVEDEFQGLLIVLYDRSIYAQSDEQKRILEAAFNSYDGQFITNEKGYILQPNQAFKSYTGMTDKQLRKLTVVEWIGKQVTLKNGITVDDVLRTLLTERKWSGEVKVSPYEGTVFHSVLSLSMLLDEEHNVEHYVGTLQDITDIKQAQEEIERLAYYDELTGLANRRLLTEHLEISLQHHQRGNSYSTLLYIDLDNFKEINDLFGHQVGDSLLKHTAKRLSNHLRAEDIIARISGDEFVVVTQYSVLSSETAVQHALTLSNKLKDELGKAIEIDGHMIETTASIGTCVFPTAKDDTPEGLIGFADLAMYEAKQQGRNQVFFYRTELTQRVLKRRELEDALKNADLDKEFFLAYQPQISNQHDTVSAEALIRWQHPQLGFVRPDQFISVAEDNKQILRLGNWILRQAFRQAKIWNERSDQQVHISVNISPVQFHEANFIDSLQAICEETHGTPEFITLELTEGILISDMEEALQKIQRLEQLGYKLSIDDFGTGYSSLSYFQKLPIHELKIDQSFVFRLPGSDEDIAIVNTIIQLAKSKNLMIVAEGVETAEQVEFFKSMTCEILMQGYYYSKPIDAATFENSFLSLKSS